MNNKKIIIITSIIIFIILTFFVFYLLVIKPVIVGEYSPSRKECHNAYKCDCLQDTCICFYKKWFWENRLVCEKEVIKDKQIKK